MPTLTYSFCVSRTTFRGHIIKSSILPCLYAGFVSLNPNLLIRLLVSTGHLLGVLASWIVQVGIDIYRFFSSISKAREDNDTVDTPEQARILVKKVYGATIRCGASLIFASIGAGIGATFIRPSAGQWIGTTR